MQIAQKSECKMYIAYSETFQGNFALQGKGKLLKNSECKKYIPYRETFLGNSVFQGKRMQVAQNS